MYYGRNRFAAMSRQSSNASRYDNGVETILRNSIKSNQLVTMFKANPTNFTISDEESSTFLSEAERFTLLNTDYNMWKKHIDPTKRSMKTRITLWVENPNKRAELYDEKKMTRSHFEIIAQKKPKLFETKSLPLSKLTEQGWKCLLIHNKKKYEPLFLDNLKTFKNATEVRNVFRSHPSLIKQLTPDHTEDTALTPKQWILFINDSDLQPKRGRKYKYTKETSDWLEMQVTMDVLAGTATKSVPLKRARDKLTR